MYVVVIFNEEFIDLIEKVVGPFPSKESASMFVQQNGYEDYAEVEQVKPPPIEGV